MSSAWAPNADAVTYLASVRQFAVLIEALASYEVLRWSACLELPARVVYLVAQTFVRVPSPAWNVKHPVHM